MKHRAPERMDDGAALEELFAHFPVSSSYTLGFLAAVRTGPDAIATSAWLAELGVPPQETAKGDLLTRLSGAVAETLRTEPETTAPELDAGDEEARDFCLGYVRGARLHATWKTDEAATAKLASIEALASPGDGASAEQAARRAELRSLVGGLHAYWKGKRQVVSAAAKVGRNDPCPCGSGKKHKKCCLAVAER